MRRRTLFALARNWFIPLLVLGPLLLALLPASVVAADSVVTFPDANLEAAIRERIDKPTGDIFESDLVHVGDLSADSLDIKDLSGLEHCTGLYYLTLEYNHITDIRPLSGLPEYTNFIELGHNNISDLSPLSGHCFADCLGLSYNQITSLSGLSDFRVGDLMLGYNQITDISPLVGSGVSIGNAVDLSGNPLNSASINTYIPALRAKGVQVAWDGDTPVVADFPDPNLEDAIRDEIGKPSGEIYESDLDDIDWFDASGRGIVDVTGLEHCRNLLHLDLLHNQITDLSLFPSLGLMHLDLSYNGIRDASALADCGFDALVLSHNQITNCSGLHAQEILDLSYNRIGDLSSCSGFHTMSMYLDHNQITDIGPLVNDPSIVIGSDVDLRGNPLNTISISSYIPALQARDIQVSWDAAASPSVTTNPAAGIAQASATLNGHLTSLGNASSAQVSFEWGLTRAYGNTTPLQTMTATGAFSAAISTLTPEKTYHFRAKVVAGDMTDHGEDAYFTTAAAPSVGTIDVTSEPTGASFTISGPSTYSETTPWSYAGAPVGEYTIAWAPMPGHVMPNPETITLGPGGAISFHGEYVPGETPEDGAVAERVHGIPVEFRFNSNLSRGSDGPDVRYLQIVLNMDSETQVATSGAGSPGNETNSFGAATEAAVKKFQTKYAAEVLTPAGLSEATGTVAERTRAKLNQILDSTFTAQYKAKYGLLNAEERKRLILTLITQLKDQYPSTDFPEQLVLAIAAQETGEYADWNNEHVADDWGRGIMQITSDEYVGAGGMQADTPACVDCRERKSKVACSRYYSNTREGIEANIRDGLAALREKYGYANKPVWSAVAIDCSGTATTISAEDFKIIAAIWGYNGRVTDSDKDYLWDVAQKLRTVKTVFNTAYDQAEIDGWACKLEWANSHRPEMKAKIGSAGELRVYDSQGRVTGLVDGVVKQEVPNSVFNQAEESIEILFPSDSYFWEVVGVAEGTYGLQISTISPDETAIFNAVEISTSPGAVHRYTLDRQSSGSPGGWVTVEIDSNGDGEFERTVTSDSELTADEFQAETGSHVHLWVYLAAGAGGLVALGILGASVALLLRRRPAR